MSSPLDNLSAVRAEFLTLVADIRPDLHRYCARMVGSVVEGEDVVQEVLARAFYALPQQVPVPALRPWLFRIAHNCATDHLRRAEYRATEVLDEELPGDAPAVDELLARQDATQAALALFSELAPAQRSAVILKDVLGHSLEEAAELLQLSLPGIKAALHRGRTRLSLLGSRAAPDSKMTPLAATVKRWAELFNARDWDGLRSLLADDARLDLVARTQRSGPPVGDYFTNYALRTELLFVPGWLEGAPAIAVFRAGSADPFNFVLLEHSARGVHLIRDFHYVPYIGVEAVFIPE